MRENRPSGSEGGGAEANEFSLPLFLGGPSGTKIGNSFHTVSSVGGIPEGE